MSNLLRISLADSPESTGSPGAVSGGRPGHLRRCSSMVEHLPSKQVTRVRFPSPTPPDSSFSFSPSFLPGKTGSAWQGSATPARGDPPAPVATAVEQLTCNQKAAGSNPARGSIPQRELHMGQLANWNSPGKVQPVGAGRSMVVRVHPVPPIRGISADGSALDLGSRGRRFEPGISHQSLTGRSTISRHPVKDGTPLARRRETRAFISDG